jgi:hypothetical protein
MELFINKASSVTKPHRENIVFILRISDMFIIEMGSEKSAA